MAFGKTGFSHQLDSRGDGTGIVAATGLFADSVVTFSNATNICVLASHGFVAGDGPFQFTTTGTLPAALALATDYYVGPTVQAGDFELSLTRGGAVIPLADDGTATTTMETPFQFYWQSTENYDVFITKLKIFVQDLTISTPAAYGAISALTNGYSVQHLSAANVLIEDLLGGATINTNKDVLWHANTTEYRSFTSGDEMLMAEIDFAGRGTPLVLGGDELEKFAVTVNDDFTGLVAHNFIIEGYTERE